MLDLDKGGIPPSMYILRAIAHLAWKTGERSPSNTSHRSGKGFAYDTKLSGLLVVDVASIVDVINENFIRFSTNLKD
jgi:hypothetical protein